MNPDQLRILISDVLAEMELDSDEAIELLMLTAAQESHCGRYIKQINGPALGIFQMEPATLNDLYENYLVFRPGLKKCFSSMKANYFSKEKNLTGNLLYQIAAARLQYKRVPVAIPTKINFTSVADWVTSLAEYWKKYWNTEKGRGTVEEACGNYYRYGK